MRLDRLTVKSRERLTSAETAVRRREYQEARRYETSRPIFTIERALS